MSHQIELADLHWQMDLLQNIDAGLVVLDRNFCIQMWNGFMEHHSGLSPFDVHGQVIFERFPEIQEEWFRRKAEAVFQLRSRVFTTWQQRPYLLRFNHSLPLSGQGEFMYQNSTLLPLASVTGEVDYICLILYDVTDMATSRQQLEQMNQKLGHLSRNDRLTNLNNRGYWEECLSREFERCKRTQRPASLVMLDIDHFKHINDNHGHPAGDQALRDMSDWLRAMLRKTDIAGRYGGEEFAVLLVDTPTSGAKIFAERLRRLVEAGTVYHEQQAIKFTISLGVAEFNPELDNYSAWLKQADQALYQSKTAGRNQVTIAD